MKNIANILWTLTHGSLLSCVCAVLPVCSWKCLCVLRCTQVCVTVLWLRTGHSWSRAGWLCAWARHAAGVPAWLWNPTRVACAHQHQLCKGAVLCAPGSQWSVMHPTDTLAAWADWDKFQQNPFTSEFADLLRWKCMSEMFPYLSGAGESWARLHVTLPNGLAGYLGRTKTVVFWSACLPWLPIAGWRQP